MSLTNVIDLLSNIISTDKSACDLIDKLNFKYTSRLLLTFAIAQTILETFSQRIVCQTQEKFVDYYCYYHSYTNDEELKTTHYQNISWILLTQAFLYYSPILIWQYYGTKSGLNLPMIFSIIDSQTNVITVTTDKLNSYLNYVKSNIKLPILLRTVKCYLIMKILFVIIGIIQLVFIIWILTISNWLPLQVHCKLNSTSVDQQCILPLNPIYIYIYWCIVCWLIVLIISTFISFVRLCTVLKFLPCGRNSCISIRCQRADTLRYFLIYMLTKRYDHYIVLQIQDSIPNFENGQEETH